MMFASVLLVPALAAHTLLAPRSLVPQPCEGPEATHYQWGSDVNEEAWLWERPASTQLVWMLPGGGWSQEPGEFEPTGIPGPLQSIYDAGISVGVAGYNTTDLFPIPEQSLEGLVMFTRVKLGFNDVTLVGRSAGAHMALYNGILAVGSTGADRVCVIQTPFASIPTFIASDSSPALEHFWPLGSKQVLQVQDLPMEIQIAGSSALWPYISPPQPKRRVCVIGQPKELEVPLSPVPIGVLSFMRDGHSAFSSAFQAWSMIDAGWQVEFADSSNGGEAMAPPDLMSQWLEGALLQ